MFDEFDTEDLKQIFDLSLENERVSEIVKQEKSAEGKLYLREHAFAEYWHRRMISSEKLTNEDIRTIISYTDLPISENVLGDAARLGLLDKSKCSELSKHVSKCGWAYKAISARLLIFDAMNTRSGTSIYSGSAGSGDDDIYIADILNQLIALKMVWAVLEVIPYLKSGELKELKCKMEDKSLLNRGNRHLVREQIDKIIKARRLA